MDLYFIKFKFISITWFMLFTIISILTSYTILNWTKKDYDLDKDVVDNMYFFIIIFGFIGARLSYFIFNLKYYNDLLSILSLNHYNLSLLGGVISGILVVLFYAKKHNISINKIISLFSISFYFSMMIGIWNMYFDKLLFPMISKTKLQFILIALSFIFFLGIVLESVFNNKHKYASSIILFLIITAYYIVKMIAL